MEVPTIRCPHCNHLNTSVTAYCTSCAEPLARPIKPSRGWSRIFGGERLRPTPPPTPRLTPPVRYGAPPSRIIDYKATSTEAFRVQDYFPRFPPLEMSVRAIYVMAAGIAIVALVAIYFYLIAPYFSSEVVGSHLGHRFFEYSSYRYALRYKNQEEVWSAHHEVLDKQLTTFHSQDSATLSLSTLSSNAKRQTLLVESPEWKNTVQSGQGAGQQHWSTVDHSPAAASVLLNKEGHVLSRSGALGSPIGRSLPFLFPKWPKGLYRAGTHWDETVEWMDRFDAWTVHWEGHFAWTLIDYEPCGRSSCARLSYKAQLLPSLDEVPSWVHGSRSAVSFSGQAEGNALLDMQQQQLLSNKFFYHGSLWTSLSDTRHASTRRHNAPAKVHSPGSLVIQFNNSIHLKKS